MQRSLQPEILDTLPPDHPDALHNRRDLALTNRILGTHDWMEQTLPGLVRPGERVLEIGAGIGELGSRLSARGLTVDGLDLWPRPAAWPAGCEWHQEDLRTFEGYSEYPVIIGNFIFHQFRDEELAEVGRKIREKARVFVTCEPTRRKRSQWLFRVVAPLLKANHVTMHDGIVSIAAGFRGRELVERMGFDSGAWDVSVTFTFLGIYRLVAIRRG